MHTTTTMHAEVVVQSAQSEHQREFMVAWTRVHSGVARHTHNPHGTGLGVVGASGTPEVQSLVEDGAWGSLEAGGALLLCCLLLQCLHLLAAKTFFYCQCLTAHAVALDVEFQFHPTKIDAKKITLSTFASQDDRESPRGANTIKMKKCVALNRHQIGSSEAIRFQSSKFVAHHTITHGCMF